MGQGHHGHVQVFTHADCHLGIADKISVGKHQLQTRVRACRDRPCVSKNRFAERETADDDVRQWFTPCVWFAHYYLHPTFCLSQRFLV